MPDDYIKFACPARPCNPLPLRCHFRQPGRGMTGRQDPHRPPEVVTIPTRGLRQVLSLCMGYREPRSSVAGPQCRVEGSTRLSLQGETRPAFLSDINSSHLGQYLPFGICSASKTTRDRTGRNVPPIPTWAGVSPAPPSPSATATPLC